MEYSGEIMTNFEPCISQFGLHDTTINKVELKNNSIVFDFHNGVYLYDFNRKLTKKTEPCSMNVFINDFNIEKAYEHVEIKQIYKSKIKEIIFQDFLKLLNKNYFQVYLDYYSFFANSILLIGTIQKHEIQIKITEVDRITFDF